MNIPKNFTIDTSQVREDPQPQSSEPAAASPSLSPSSPSSPDAGAEGSSFLPDTPEYAGLKGKFKTPEDLAKSYIELERRQSGKQPEPAPEPSSEVNFQAFAQEFAAQGKLSDESYSKLWREHRIPRAAADAYIAGQQALAQQQMGEVFQYAGISSAEDYANVAKWAQQNLSAQELDTFNTAVAGVDLGVTKMAVAHLYQRYQLAHGHSPNLFQGRTVSGPAVPPYESQEQVIADMKNPLYKKDPAFRAKVDARLEISDVLNRGRIK